MMKQATNLQRVKMMQVARQWAEDHLYSSCIVNHVLPSSKQGHARFFVSSALDGVLRTLIIYPIPLIEPQEYLVDIWDPLKDNMYSTIVSVD